MKLKYALYEQKKNKLMTILFFIQTMIVFIMIVIIISAIFSRYEKYKPLESFFRGDGLNMHMTDLLGRGDISALIWIVILLFQKKKSIKLKGLL